MCPMLCAPSFLIPTPILSPSSPPECLLWKLTRKFHCGKLSGHLSVLISLNPSAAEFDSEFDSLFLAKLSFLNSRMAPSPPFSLTSLVDFVGLSSSAQSLKVEMHQGSVLKHFLYLQSLPWLSPVVSWIQLLSIIPKLISLAWTPLLYSKLMYPAVYLTSPPRCLKGISKLCP